MATAHRLGWRGGESPVEDRGHVDDGGQIAAARGFFEVAVGMVAGFGGKSDQMSSEGGPGGFGRQARDVLVNVVAVGDGLRSDGLFGGEVEAVGVTLNGIE
jgi:hypothetical protein